MRRLIWGLAGRTYHIVGNLMHWLIFRSILHTYACQHCLTIGMRIAYFDGRGVAEHQSGRSWSVKLLITLETHRIFEWKFVYLFIPKLSCHWYAKRWKDCWKNLTHRKTAENHKIYVTLKNMQIQIIINNNILKTSYLNFAWPTYVLYNHCVSQSVRPSVSN